VIMGFCRVVHRWTTLQNPMITAEGQGAGRQAGGRRGKGRGYGRVVGPVVDAHGVTFLVADAGRELRGVRLLQEVGLASDALAGRSRPAPDRAAAPGAHVTRRAADLWSPAIRGHLGCPRGRLFLVLVRGQGMCEDTTGPLEGTRAFAGLLPARAFHIISACVGHGVRGGEATWTGT